MKCGIPPPAFLEKSRACEISLKKAITTARPRSLARKALDGWRPYRSRTSGEPCHPEGATRQRDLGRPGSLGFARERARRAHGDERFMLTLSPIWPPSLVPEGLDDSGAPSTGSGSRPLGARIANGPEIATSQPGPCHPEGATRQRDLGRPGSSAPSPFARTALSPLPPGEGRRGTGTTVFLAPDALREGTFPHRWRTIF
jgi:hypothetical protein